MSLDTPTHIPTTQVPREFRAGTLGWVEADLDDPRLASESREHRYEIIHGVLTEMPPAYFAGSTALSRLIGRLDNLPANPSGRIGQEVHIVLDEDRVVIADGVFLTDLDWDRQTREADRRGQRNVELSRLYIPPTLIIESTSIGHERHDVITKGRWYAEFSVQNYWILNPAERSLKCFVLNGSTYRAAATGRQSETVLLPTPYATFSLDLSSLWMPIPPLP